MSGLMPEPSRNQAGNGRGSFSLRVLAIILMVVGVILFVIARIVFGEQVLCLVGSTLITFSGLGLIIAGRRQGWESGRSEASQRQAAVDNRRAFRPNYRAPAGLRSPARSRSNPSPKPDPVAPLVEPAAMFEVRNADPSRVSLLERTASILESQGAQVRVEAQREDRGILRITTRDGRVITIMVREDAEVVDVADVRALHALVSGSAAEAGYLIAAGPITERAYEMAGTRQIRLVAADELDELGV